MNRIKVITFIFLAVIAPFASRASVYQVGPGKTYTSISSLPRPLLAGDIVEIYYDPAYYKEAVKWTESGTIANPITLMGMGSLMPVIDGTGVDVSGAGAVPRALFQFNGSNYIVENIAFQNAANGNNGAGIRVTGGGDNITIKACKITYCDMGMMSDGNGSMLVDSCEVAFNGTSLYNGYSHNFYLSGYKSTIQFSYIHDALYGQNFKARGHYVELFYNYIADSNEGEVGPVDQAGVTDIPDSNAVMIGNIIISKPARTGNTGKFIDFGADMGNGHTGTLYLVNNTLIAGDNRINFINPGAAGVTIYAANNIFYNSNKIQGAGPGIVTGGNNWVQTGAVIPAGFINTTSGADPDFVNYAARDFHLNAGSNCRDIGVGSPVYFDGSGVQHSAVPAFEYVNHLTQTARGSDGAPDAGAYEHLGPSFTPSAAATDTPVASPTDTIIPAWTDTAVLTPSFTPTFTITPTLSISKTVTAAITGTPVAATNTPAITETATGTDTPAPAGTAAITASFTLTPQYSATSTGTAGANDEFKINGVVVYPNPSISGEGTLYVHVDITQQPKSVRMKMYTASFRLIKDKTWPAASITGHYDMNLPIGGPRSLANGIYYYILTAEDSAGRHAKSAASGFIVLK